MENVIYLSSWFNWLFVIAVVILALMLVWNNSPMFKNGCINLLSKIDNRKAYTTMGGIIGLAAAGILVAWTVPVIEHPLMFLICTLVVIVIVFAIQCDSDYEFEHGEVTWWGCIRGIIFTAVICACVGYCIQVGCNDTFTWVDFAIRLSLLILCWIGLFLPGLLFDDNNKTKW